MICCGRGQIGYRDYTGCTSTIEAVRVSYGSALELGLLRGRTDARTTTLYLFVSNTGCRGSCAFCPQPYGESSRISRVEWPRFSLDQVARTLIGASTLRRICIQCSDEPGIASQAEGIVKRLAPAGLPFSVSASPLSVDDMERLKDAGVEILTIPVDCADKERYRYVKGRDLEEIMDSLKAAVKVFGRGKVGTHIIVGLGESEREAVEMIDTVSRMGVAPSLFAFTPIEGTRMENAASPTIGAYRRVQIARHLIVEAGMKASDFKFGPDGRITGFGCSAETLERVFNSGHPFMVCGCPGCNRPYFNEKASGPFYNYPFRPDPKRVAEETWSD
ncbi:MAG: radical SAM protein [Candidatus Verstraetearchaeota archaeon]|nr:radical SAM protein [Candidatus Verstraetearchaeota archaeon]